MSANVIGNYKVIEKIGEGGMGAVYKGVDLMLEREVAIKALRPELARQPHLVERFRTEAVTLARLNHPNIATLHSFFRQGEDYYMVMEFVRGETLEAVLRRSGGMTSDWAVPLFCQALEGIDHAHRLGIIHRDIKPANMMLTQSGSIKVMDFGIARVLGTDRMTKQGNIIGTIEYMSPEQVRGHETDSRSDIYSLGILLYEMLTGRVPFSSNSEYELMRSQIEDPPTPPREFAPYIPLPIEEAIMRALAKRPDARFQTAGEFRRVLLSGVKPSTSPLGSRPSAQFATEPKRGGQILAPGEMSKPSSASRPGSLWETGTADHLRSSSLAGESGSKETRVMDDKIPPKETRLPDRSYQAIGPGVGVASGQPYGPGAPPPGYVHGGQIPGATPSLFDKLTWKVYVGVAAVIVLMITGAAVLVANVLSLSTKSQQPGSAGQNAIVPQSNVQQLQVQPLASPIPGASPTPTAQSDSLGGQPLDEQKLRRTERAGSSGGNLQGPPSDGSASVGPPITAPAPVGPANPPEKTAVSHPRDSTGSRPPPSSSARDTKPAPSPEKKKGLFGKIKDKILKHDSDKNQ
jgi:serine/threonine protein kinase